MTKQELVARMQEGQAWIPGKRVKLDFGGEGVVLLDGAGEQVTEEDGAADTTIKVAWEDWQAMAAGQLDGIRLHDRQIRSRAKCQRHAIAGVIAKLRVDGRRTAKRIGALLARLERASSGPYAFEATDDPFWATPRHEPRGRGHHRDPRASERRVCADPPSEFEPQRGRTDCRIARALAEAGISANIVAALRHDHLFVPWDRREDALARLKALSQA